MRKLRLIILLILLVASSGLAAAQQSETLQITHGPLSGEVSSHAVTLWARGGEAGTIRFEVADNQDFSGDVIAAEVEVSEEHDFIAEARIEGLQAGTRYFYRALLVNADEAQSPMVVGQFQTAPDSAAAFDFVFGACLGGQGYCRDPENGWVIFDAMLAQQPDFFLITGDSIYGSGACPTDQSQNVPGAEAPGTDLDSFRARYKYHLEDAHYAAFLAQTPVFAGWDDHEVRDNYSAPLMRTQNPDLVAGAHQAFFEYWPVSGTSDDPYRLYRSWTYGDHADFFMLDTRSYRDPIVNWDTHPRTLQAKTMLGADQLAWLREGLLESDATWKFIVTSVPLSVPTGFPQPEVEGRDGWANAADRTGYETELMSLLFYIEGHDISNVIFLAGDTHFPYAVSYDPDRDGAADFYELSSSPLSALVLPPVPLDLTFNPTLLYAEGEFQGTLFNFGQVSVAEDGTLTFRIIDREGAEHYSLTLEPEG